MSVDTTGTTPPTEGRTVIVTVVAGRHAHLRRHRRSIVGLDPAPLAHVVVSMGDAEVADLVDDGALPRADVVHLPAQERMPLSRARNVGVARARELGAEAVVLLDVDCIASPDLVADYVAAWHRLGDAPAVVCGRVRYLPEGLTEEDHVFPRLHGLGEDHALRVVPPDAGLVPGDVRMLWSLNIGARLQDWDAFAGFDERYEGYGGEDTDLGQRLRAAGGQMWWMRGGCAYHQYHPVSSPPVEHLADILRNARLFRQTWGWWPMEGWLTTFEQRGLLRRGADGWEAVSE